MATALVTGASQGVGGYERMVEGGRFTWPDPFWEQPRWRWEAMMTAGARAAFVASQLAPQIMLPGSDGLIVNVSAWAAQKHIGNMLYGIARPREFGISPFHRPHDRGPSG